MIVCIWKKDYDRQYYDSKRFWGDYDRKSYDSMHLEK